VRSANVQRRLPDRIQVTIKEHIPVIIIALDELYLANEDGEIFKRLATDDRVVLPVVRGLGREDVALRPEAASARIREATAVAAAVEQETTALGRLEELHWDADLGWSLVVRPSIGGDVGLRIHLGFMPIRRLVTAKVALARLRQHNLEPEVLWADGTKNPNRVQARLRDTAFDRDATFIAKAR